MATIYLLGASSRRTFIKEISVAAGRTKFTSSRQVKNAGTSVITIIEQSVGGKAVVEAASLNSQNKYYQNKIIPFIFSCSQMHDTFMLLNKWIPVEKWFAVWVFNKFYFEPKL